MRNLEQETTDAIKAIGHSGMIAQLIIDRSDAIKKLRDLEKEELEYRNALAQRRFDLEESIRSATGNLCGNFGILLEHK